MNQSDLISAKELIEHSASILLHCHPSPDGDSVGSALAMYWVLRGMGKNVVVIAGDTVPPQNMNCLPGFEFIKEQNWQQTDLSNFDLFISLDSSSVNQITKLSNVVFPGHLQVMVIDHHPTNTHYGHINIVEENFPATAQVLYEIFVQWGVEITPEISINLFVGLYTDTGGFKYPLTTSRTYEIAGKLVEKYPDFANVLFELENNNEPERLLLLGLGFTHVELFCGGRLAISSLDNATLTKYGITRRHTDITRSELANLMKSVPSHEIGVSMIEVAPSEIWVSVRRRNELIDVGAITQILGGGGHKAAAGATMWMSLDEAKRELVRVVEEMYFSTVTDNNTNDK